MLRCPLPTAAALALIAARALTARAATNAPAADAAAKPETAAVQAGPFRVDLALQGLLMPAAATPVAVVPEAWTDLLVTRAAPHGARVKAGEVLVAFDLRSLDKAVADLEAERELKETELQRAVADLAALEQGTELALREAARAKDLADQDVRLFATVDRPLETRKAERQARQHGQQLLYEREELAQLERMYKADDLTEETEEIILLRQRHAVSNQAEIATDWLQYRDRQLAVDLPRREAQVALEAERQALALAAVRVARPLDVRKKRLEVDGLRDKQREAAERLARLRRDREALTVRAPAAGTVYYGRLARADWVAAEAEKVLVPGGRPPPHQTLMTLVADGPLEAHVWLREEDLQFAAELRAGRAAPKGFPWRDAPATLKTLAAVPDMKGWHLAQFTVDWPADAPPLAAGMAVAVHAVPVRLAAALTVPAGCVFADDAGGGPCVYVAGADGKSAARTVKPGWTWSGRTEIRAGLQAGETVLTKRPE